MNLFSLPRDDELFKFLAASARAILTFRFLRFGRIE